MNGKVFAFSILLFGFYPKGAFSEPDFKIMAYDSLSIIPKQIITSNLGEIKGKYTFIDKLGSHLLILSRSESESKDGTQKISLQAKQFLKADGNWKQEWAINDLITCKDLDIFGDFSPDLTRVTDLDSNKIYESTVTYKLICTGDVSPMNVKTIFRQQNLKYAVRGESLVSMEGSPSYGGTFLADAILSGKPSIKKFLISVWKMGAGYKE